MSDFPDWFTPNALGFFERNVPRDTPLRALQIGTYTGDASVWLLKNTNVQSLDDVDTWEGSPGESVHSSLDFKKVYEYYVSRVHELDPHSEKVAAFQMTSDEYFSLYKACRYNFIYVDGDHTASQTAIDGINAFNVLEPGGILAFDDYLWWSGLGPVYEPRRGIDAVLSIFKGTYEVLDIGYQVWIKKL